MANEHPINEPEEINQSHGFWRANPSGTPLFYINKQVGLIDLLEAANTHLAAATEIVRRSAVDLDDEAVFGGLYLCEQAQAVLRAATECAYTEQRAASTAPAAQS
jgi:hypothetical protein